MGSEVSKNVYEGAIKKPALKLERFPATAINRAFEFPGDKRGDAMIQPRFAHFLPPGSVQVLPAATPAPN